MNIAGDWADTLAEKILGSHCACYAEAWPAHTCANEVAEVAKLIRAFFAVARLVVVPEEPTEAMVEAAAVRLVSFEDGSIWPDSWDHAQVVQARILGERALRSAIAAAKEPDR